MALEGSARVAVTNAIENKEDLERMLGKYLPTTMQSMLAFLHTCTGTHVQAHPLFAWYCVMGEGHLPSCSLDMMYVQTTTRKPCPSILS